ncbi:hypothetical protein [Ornithinimicrobium sp. LYQ103]|uniref:hypothetical protein n=1 Tax=Ornithinimicrobium sp. LYQ103 TaxID=3378796 RepID=UPI003852C083
MFAVVGAVVASLLVGFIFYHPTVMSTRWTKAVGHTLAMALVSGCCRRAEVGRPSHGRRASRRD